MTFGTILTEMDKEIINLGTSLAAGCQPCLKYHLRKCKGTGLSEKEIIEIINLTEEICTRAIEVMKLRALAHVNNGQYKEAGFHVRCNSREELLLGLTVSYTLSNTYLTDRFLEYAKQSDMSDSEISSIMEISNFICGKARAHVDILIEERGIENHDTKKDGNSCGCSC